MNFKAKYDTYHERTVLIKAYLIGGDTIVEAFIKKRCHLDVRDNFYYIALYYGS